MLILRPHRFGIALGTTGSLFYSLYAVAMTYWPQATLNLVQSIFYGTNLKLILGDPLLSSFGTYLRGLFVLFIFFYFFGLLTGFIYTLNAGRRLS